MPVGTSIQVYVSLGPEEEELPAMQDLTGMTESAAKAYLNALEGELVVDVLQENHDDVAEGLVTRTVPAANEPLVRGQTVEIYISLGPGIKLAKVPSVIGEDRDQAAKILTENGFDNYRFETEESQQPKDEVTRLSVVVGSEIDVTTEIVIYVSEGVVRVAVPAVTEMTYTKAVQELNEMGFFNIEPVYEENEAEKDTVFRQSISAGVEIDITTTITLYVSEGVLRSQVPKLTGMTEEAAIEALKTAGFTKYKVEHQENDAEKGKVFDQSVAPGETALFETEIIFYVSEGPKETTAPPTTEPDKTVNVTIALPGDMTEEYTLTVMFGSETIVDEQVIQPGTGSIVVQLTGKGTGYYEVYINGEYDRTEKVNFGGE